MGLFCRLLLSLFFTAFFLFFLVNRYLWDLVLFFRCLSVLEYHYGLYFLLRFGSLCYYITDIFTYFSFKKLGLLTDLNHSLLRISINPNRLGGKEGQPEVMPSQITQAQPFGHELGRQPVRVASA